MPKPTLFITTWRTPFDDDDTLDIRLAHQAPTARQMKAEETDDYDPTREDAEDYHPFEISERDIADGALLEDEHGNEWRVRFTRADDPTAALLARIRSRIKTFHEGIVFSA